MIIDARRPWLASAAMFARTRRITVFVVAAVAGGLTLHAEGVTGERVHGAPDHGAPDHEAAVRFARDVRPILSDRCFSCHGPDAAARDADLALDRFEAATADRGGYRVVAPGDPDASELIARVTAHGSSDLMPPGRAGEPLPEREVATLRRWIEQGATYEAHWSHVAPRLPALPLSELETAAPHLLEGARNEVDLFVRARLAGGELEPRDEAPRATLVRRLCLTLWGLPAPLELVDRALADTRDDWYERLVDELLHSPRHGEHMARQWLDAARYGDTHGLHLDNERAIHPYRDWVIDAFTQNLPYDEFVIHQLAGDLLPDPTRAQLVATGFNRCNPTTAEAGLIDAEYLANYAWDRVDTTSTVFLGLTMACAKCHDHKFDPFTQQDYYGLYSFFDDMEGAASDENRADPEPAISVATVEQSARLRELDVQLAELAAVLDAPDATLDEALRAWVDEERERDAGAIEAVEPQPDLGDGVPPFTGSLQEPVSELGPWESTGPVLDPDGGYPLDVDFGPDPGGLADELAWHAIDLPIGETFAWSSDHSVTYFRTRITLDSSSRLHWRFACDDSIRVWIDETEVLRRDTDIGYVPELFEVRCELPPGEHVLLVRIVNRLGGFLLHEGVQLHSCRPPESILAAIRRASSAPDETDAQAIRGFFRRNVSDRFAAEFAAHDRLSAEREALVAALPRTLISRDRAEPVVTHVLERGLYDRPGAVVESNVPAVFGSLPPDAPRNRLALARWIVAPENPLAARVAVNRVWQQHFGRGLVATPEDFGLQGAWPSHPELLDWLAVRFVEEGWDLAWLHHTILASATWRQSSDAPAEHWRADPHNVLLARGARFRVDAEVVRDSALFAAGLLSPKVGGASVKPYQPDGVWRAVAYPSSNTADYVRGTGDDLHRRSLYTFWKRTAPPASLALLDAPSREFCVVERERTNTPLQALVLLNDEQFVEAARVFAARALREAPSDDVSRATFLVRTCLARQPRAEEVAVLLALLDDCRLSLCDEDDALLAHVDAVRDSGGPNDGGVFARASEAAAPIDDAARELAAWTFVASTVLNLDEFLNLD